MRSLDENEIRKVIYNEIKIKSKKGYVQLNTNLGEINI
jgi:hypothetical protein